MIAVLIFLFFVVLLFVLSRRVTNELFFLVYSIIKNKKISLYLVSLLYFPGTVVHELSHFLAAAALLLKVRHISIFPEISDEYVKLGSVQYERADYVRGLLVGISPFLIGIFILYVMASENVLASESLFIKFFASYFIFVLSSTMFSSKKDLEDLIFVIPILIIIAILFYILNIDITLFFQNQKVQNATSLFIERINYYLLISVLINCAIFCIVKLAHVRKRHI